MQAASEKYGVPFTQLSRAGRDSVTPSFNLPHDKSPHSSSSGRARSHPEQSPSTAQHHLQQQLRQHLQHSQHHDHRHQALQQPALPAAQQQQRNPQKPHADRHDSRNDSQNRQVREVQHLPAWSDAPTTPSKPPDDLNKGFRAAANKPLPVEDHDDLAEDAERGGSGSRWPRDETLALLKLRSDMDASFRDTNLKAPLWEEISRKLAEMGYHRNAKKCREKFENVQKYYKRTKEGKAGRHDGKTYRFFTQLEALQGNTSGNTNVLEAISRGTSQDGGVSGHFETEPVISHVDHMTGVLASKVLPAPRHESDYSSGLNFSSESSDDEYESENPNNRKRKRKSPSQPLLCFFKNLVHEVLNKQEQMQKTLLDALERRESERMIREEAWKRQEMARLTRDQELRAQERSMAAKKDAALLAFLQRLTDQTLEIPSASASMAIVAGGGAEAEHESEMVVKLPSEDENQIKDRDPNNKRWPKPEVQLLIKLRSELQPKFLESGAKGMFWKEISDAMAKMGFSRSAKRCKEKWENINKYFKKAKQRSRERPENSKTCPYFQELDSLYRKGVLKSLAFTSTAQLTYPCTKLANGLLHPDHARHDQLFGPTHKNGSTPVAPAAAASTAADAAIDVSSTAHPRQMPPAKNFNGGRIFSVSSSDQILSSTSQSAPSMNHVTHRQQSAQNESAIQENSAQQSPVVTDGDEEKIELIQDETTNQTQSSSSIDRGPA